ncbi:MAG: hypothetical protein RL021_1431 [Bacteroidota bacterium]|jgi:SAM-dependent methyltransferase
MSPALFMIPFTAKDLYNALPRTMIHQLQAFNRKQQFRPGLLSLLTNANHFTKRGIYKGIIRHASACKGIVLDVGCGNKPYRDLFIADEYIGIDINNPAHDHSNEPVDVIYDGRNIPFPDNRFDSVFSSEVFEHVFQPEELLREMHRVLKPGGKLLMTLPFVFMEHEQPYDFARYTSFGIRSLLERNGYEIHSIERSSTFLQATTVLVANYIHHALLPRNKYLRFPLSFVTIGAVNLLGGLLSMALPDQRDLCLNHIVVAAKK